MSYQKGIGHNFSSADSALTNHKGNAPSWLRSKFGVFVAGHCTPVIVVDRIWGGAIHIIYIMDLRPVRLERNVTLVTPWANR